MEQGRGATACAARERFTQIGYLYTPVALFSLFLGLSKPTFAYLLTLGLAPSAVDAMRLLLLTLGVFWSLFLGFRILGSRLRGWRVSLALMPHVVALALIVMAWAPILRQ